MSKKRICLVSLLVAFALCGPIARGQENQIVNGEFDDGLDSWGTYGSARYDLQVVQGAALSGGNAIMIDVLDASAGTAVGFTQGGLELVQGKTYPIGFTAKAEQDREIVVVLQIYKTEIPQWLTVMETTVQLTTTPQSFSLAYQHASESTTDHPEWSVDIYYILKGPFWPMTGDDLNVKVWVDRLYFGAEIPAQPIYPATNPSPEDGTLHLDTWVSLGWRPGDFAATHDVYLGDNFDDVNDGLADTYRGNQPTTDITAGFPGYPYPEGLVPGTTYYWRIDEVNDADPNSPWKGQVWNFTVPPRIAYAPNPPDGDKFVDPNIILEWMPGLDGNLHIVHFGDNFDDVNNAGPTAPHSPVTYDPGTLEREKTYYWRVDEFDGDTTRTGDIWSFTVAKEGGGLKGEYFNNRDLAGVPVLTRVDPQIDFQWGSGDVPGENSPDASISADDFSARWSGELEVDITDTYTFKIVANNGFRLFLDDEAIIDYWDGAATRQSDPIELVAGTSHSIRMEYYEGVATANARLSWTSSVREDQVIPQGAFSLPLRATTPIPASGATDAQMTAILTWSAGDSATSHEVYFGTDADAVANATNASPEYVGPRALGAESYDPGGLAWDSSYAWRVDEVYPTGTIKGLVWSFETADFIVVDDFELYNDLAEDDPASNRIYLTWIDGFGTTTNGAIAGNLDVPLMSPGRDSTQAMPLSYDNAGKTSEATRTLTSGKDWTEQGVAKLVVWFSGDAANAPDRMFVALGNAVVYHPDDAATQDAGWNEWIIDLQEFANQGADLSNIGSITVGFGTRNAPVATGGTGVVEIDDIRLIR